MKKEYITPALTVVELNHAVTLCSVSDGSIGQDTNGNYSFGVGEIDDYDTSEPR